MRGELWVRGWIILAVTAGVVPGAAVATGEERDQEVLAVLFPAAGHNAGGLAGPSSLDAGAVRLKAQGAAPARPADAPSSAALGPGDELTIAVLGYPELSGRAVILPDETVSLPLAGSVRVGGLTSEGLAAAVERSLTDHIEEPRVSVTVIQLRSRRFSVMGEVGRPGVYPLWGDDLTILEAIAEAGGWGSGSLPDEVKVFRLSEDGTTQALHVDLAAMVRGELDPALRVRPGDVVYVPSQASRQKICILGEVSIPGLYTLGPKMTVIEALSAAGWAKPSGVLTSVMVVRRGSGASREFFRVNAKRAIAKHDWSQHLALKPGDIVYVPEQFISKLGNFVTFFTSKVEPTALTYLRVYDATDPASVLVDR